jgi:hypothetical protein
MMLHSLKKIFPISCMFFSLTLSAQVNIVNAPVNSYNITPRSLCEVSLMNAGESLTVIIEARLYNSSNEELMAVKTGPMIINKGLTSTAGLSITFSQTNFSTSAAGLHIKTTKTLPTGKYKYCCRVIALNSDFGSDDYCDEIESDLSSFLLLVSPFDKDTIQTKNPLLLWSHSEPFGVISSGEYYRIIVAEQKPDQTAESALNVNAPIYYKNNLRDHQVLYPFDGKELVSGNSYAWQVQKMTNGVITNKSEAWTFILDDKFKTQAILYAVLKNKPTSDCYPVKGDKLYFKFSEEYTSTTNLEFQIRDNSNNLLKPEKIKNNKAGDTNVKLNGDNRYEINLSAFKINEGFNLLEVTNEKKEVYFLKFYYTSR